VLLCDVAVGVAVRCCYLVLLFGVTVWCGYLVLLLLLLCVVAVWCYYLMVLLSFRFISMVRFNCLLRPLLVSTELGLPCVLDVLLSFWFVSMVRFLPSETPAGLHGTRHTVFFGG
jgi:hypothetical protein